MIKVINEYEKLTGNISYYITLSGYKKGYLAEQLGLSSVAFYKKEISGSFTFTEIKELSQFLFSKEYNKKALLLAKLFKQSLEQSNNGQTIPDSEVKRYIHA